MKIRTLVLLLSFSVLSCSTARVGQEFPKGCYPFDLAIDVNSKHLTIKWREKCNKNISGYNIYVSETPLAPDYADRQLPKQIKPINEVPYPGDTDTNDKYETYEAENLKDGIKYYVSVRIIMPDGRQSRPTREIPVVCGGRGEIELSIRYKSDHDGFSFRENQFVRADDVRNDLYYFQKDGLDYLVSPSRLNGFLRENKLAQLPFSGGLDDIKQKAAKLKTVPVEEKLRVVQGDWVRVYTPEGNNALVKVLGFSGEGENRTIKLYYAFSPLKNELFF